MFSKDVLTLVGLGTAGVIIGGLIGRYIAKTIITLEKDINLLDCRIMELEIKALGEPLLDTVARRETYAAITLQLIINKLQQYQKVLPAGGNEKIHTLRTQFIDGVITADAFTNGLLFDIYSSAK